MKLSFKRWAAAMIDIYSYNNNGHWAVIMPILAAFRKEILEKTNHFTALFLSGPACSGKTELARSIKAVFDNTNNQIFSLLSTEDIDLFKLLETYNDIVILENYNNSLISENKFQALKAIVSSGSARKIIQPNNQITSIFVNSTPVITGQEEPDRDDYSLANRTIVLSLDRLDWLDYESRFFKELKYFENQGLPNVLNQILLLKLPVNLHFNDYFQQVQNYFKSYFNQHKIFFNERILIAVSLFAAMVKLIEEQAIFLKLPFTYESFSHIAINYIIERSNSLLVSYQPTR